MQYYPAGKEHFIIDHFSQAQQIGQVAHLRLAQTLVLNSCSLWTQGWAAISWTQRLGHLPAFNFVWCGGTDEEHWSQDGNNVDFSVPFEVGTCKIAVKKEKVLELTGNQH